MIKHSDYVVDSLTNFVKIPKGKVKKFLIKVELTGKATLYLVTYVNMTDKHVDEAGLINKLTFHNFRSLKVLHQSLTKAIDEYEQPRS